MNFFMGKLLEFSEGARTFVTNVEKLYKGKLKANVAYGF